MAREQAYDRADLRLRFSPLLPRERPSAVCIPLVLADAPPLRGGAQIQIMVISREFLVMARHNLIPSWFAYVNAYTGTPLRITLIFGCIKGAHAHC